jgi:hypothetical protein
MSVFVPNTENSFQGLQVVHREGRNGRRIICHSANIKQKLMAASKLRAPLMQSDVTQIAMETAAHTQTELNSTITDERKMYIPEGKFKGSDVNIFSTVELQ